MCMCVWYNMLCCVLQLQLPVLLCLLCAAVCVYCISMKPAGLAGTPTVAR